MLTATSQPIMRPSQRPFVSAYWVFAAAVLLSGLASAQPAALARGKLTVREIVPQGGRMAWSAQGDKLAFDAPDSDRGDGLFDIFLLDDPLSGGADRRARCLTCKAPDLRQQHVINPAFHPSGGQIVFQTIALAKKTNFSAQDLNTPIRSNRSEIWLARTDGKDFWKLTDFAGIGSAVLDPSFSYEGQRLVWAERTNSKKGAYGAWKLRSGSIRTRRGVPKIAAMRVEFRPKTPALLIPHGFTLDDQGFLLSGNLEEGHTTTGIDVYLVREGKASRLTKTGGVAEETARFDPSGKHITFASNQTLRRERTPDGQPIRELWQMDLDGNNAKRLTFFNEPPADEYRGPTYIGDFEWHPDGEWLAAQIVSGRRAQPNLVLLRFQGRP